ncbi:AraC family transcriptional regulator [Metabacillus sp. GX 13764]|uniref:AraC family transcriptional regulator n=1 Tax=Metabacillus kandeliae TaxID=2900151 RepID=UPI001E5F6C77|nr:AraC family transcriptional regulator [Metabacillus kandeliae]MCD7035047.1 AraC family transcriptional regulator [Metabacillus kandeliae]
MKNKYGTIAFRFKEPSVSHIAQLWSVGWDEHTSSIYSWNGMERKDMGKVIFQYTLSGTGEIELEGSKHRLNPGHAFLVKSPSHYKYYLPEDSKSWEFMYVTLYGEEAEKCWNALKEKNLSIIHFHPEAAPIELLQEILSEANSKKITNAYKGSSLAYQFLMALYDYAANAETRMADWPESIVRSALYAKQFYRDNIGPEEMAEVSGLSRYHYIRVFKQTTGITPIQYLTKIRIQKAIELLHQTKYSIEEIAELSGYTNANYLNKVCKKVTGYSPGEIRKNKMEWEDSLPFLK